MCILSSYDSVHRWEDVKKREKVVLKHSTFKLNSCFVFYIYLCSLYSILYFVFIFVFTLRSGIVHCASVATVVPSIPHYQVIIIIIIVIIVIVIFLLILWWSSLPFIWWWLYSIIIIMMQVGGCTQWFNHFLLKSIGFGNLYYIDVYKHEWWWWYW